MNIFTRVKNLIGHRVEQKISAANSVAALPAKRSAAPPVSFQPAAAAPFAQIPPAGFPAEKEANVEVPAQPSSQEAVNAAGLPELSRDVPASQASKVVVAPVDVKERVARSLFERQVQEMELEERREKNKLIIAESNAKLLAADKAERERQEAPAREAAEARLRAAEAERSRPRTWEEEFKPLANEPGGLSLSRELVEKLIAFGNLEPVVRELAARLEPLAAKWDAAHARRSELSMSAVQQRLVQIMRSNYDAVNSGRFDEVKPLPDRERLELEHSASRAAIRESLRGISTACRPILDEFVAKLIEPAKALAAKMLADDKARAAEFAVAFEPSTVVRHVVSAAFELPSVASIWMPNAMCSPRQFFHGALNDRRPQTTNANGEQS